MYIWGISLHRIGFRTRRRIRFQTAVTAITHYSQCPDQPIAQPNETAELAPNAFGIPSTIINAVPIQRSPIMPWIVIPIGLIVFLVLFYVKQNHSEQDHMTNIDALMPELERLSATLFYQLQQGGL